jgi:hypothetical protein
MLNRLRLFKSSVFPALDGKCWLLEFSSMSADNTFVVLNDLDTMAGDATERKQAAVAGLVRKNLLYRLLPKENVFVPNAQWAAEYERSEVMEVVHMMQLIGAIVVETIHEPMSVQPLVLPPPESTGVPSAKPKTERGCASSMGCGSCVAIADSMLEASDGIARVAGAAEGAPTKALSAAGDAAASLAKGAFSAASPSSPLTGRVIFRNNALPPHSKVSDVVAMLGADFYHIRRMPHLMDRVRLRLSRGLLMADSFELEHRASWPAINRMGAFMLQGPGSLPDRVPIKAKDLIDAGFRDGDERPCFKTRFRVLYPDVNEAKAGLQIGADLPTENLPTFDAGGLHPLAGLASWGLLEPGSVPDRGGRGGSLKKKKKKKRQGGGAAAGGEGQGGDEGEEDDGEEDDEAERAEVVALKRLVYEQATDLYLERSMREFMSTSRGLVKAPQPGAGARPGAGFKLPDLSVGLGGVSVGGDAKAGGAHVSSGSVMSMLWTPFCSKVDVAGGGGYGNSGSGSGSGGGGAGSRGGGGEGAEEEGDGGGSSSHARRTAREDATALPDAIPRSRATMGGRSRRVQAE